MKKQGSRIGFYSLPIRFTGPSYQWECEVRKSIQTINLHYSTTYLDHLSTYICY